MREVNGAAEAVVAATDDGLVEGLLLVDSRSVGLKKK